MADKLRLTNKDEELTQLWEDFGNGKTYQSALGLTNNIPIWVDFLEGRHHPPSTEETKHIPKPIFNMIEMIVDNKISNVLASPIKHNFIAEGDQVATHKFTRFAEYQKKEMGQKKLDNDAAEDGATKGTYIYHYYWDEKAPGKRGNYQGGLRGQIIDIFNVAVSDPTERDEQRQKWIILASRVSVEAVKEMADKGVNKTLIVPDEKETPYSNDKEQEGNEYCTLLLRYFRKDGEVYSERGTKHTIVNKAKPLSPYLFLKLEDEEKKKKKKDFAVLPQPAAKLEIHEEENIDEFKASLYPVVIGSWKKRHGSIFGRGEVETLIPNQKAVNHEFSMQLLDHQETGHSKILVKPHALGGQEITNIPGEIITDHTGGAFWGIKTLERSNISGTALQLAPQIVDLTRTVTNSSEVITGEMISKDLSGLAIAQLQAQSQKPIARLQKNFWESQEKIGKILVQFYKLYYEDKEFTYDLTPEEFNLLQQQNMQMGITQPVNQKQFDVFDGSEFIDTNFEVVVEVGAGTQYSELQSMSMLNGLLSGGFIDFMTYIKLYPEQGMPFKSELIATEEAKQRSELQQLRALVQQMAQELEKQGSYSKEQDKAIKQLTGEVQKSHRIIGDLEKEYSEKITAQNQFVLEMLGKNQQQTGEKGE